MSPTHRYQSRLFQSARSQVRQLKDNVQLRWRQLKVAAAWGAQLGLYPLYALFQAGRWGAQVLRQAATHGKQAILTVGQREEVLAADQPIKQVLEAIELLSLPTTVADQPLGIAQIVLRPIPRPASLVTRWRKQIGTLWQRWRKQALTAPAPLNTSAALEGQTGLVQRVAIQGIASSLVHRQLVLVTSDNQLLDILTADQQRQLSQRIIWEIAQVLYLRRQRRGPRPIPGWKKWQSLPIRIRPQYSFPLRAIYRLMAWVQQPRTPVFALPPGVNLNPSLPSRSLFASLRRRWAALQSSRIIAVVRPMAVVRSPLTLPTPSAPLSIFNPLQQRLRTYRTAIVAMVGALALLPFTLALPEPAQAALAPTLPTPLPTPLLVERLIDPARPRRRWQADAALSEQTGKPQGKVRIAPQKSTAALSAQAFEGAIASWASRFSQATASGDNTTIEVDAVFMGYDHHPLEVLLLWLDRAIAWIETQLMNIGELLWSRLQHWVSKHWHH